MHETAGFSIWGYSAIIFAVVLVSKKLSKKTGTVDVLWLILAGAILTNLGLLPSHNEFLETIGEWGIVFIMFTLGLEERKTDDLFGQTTHVIEHLAFSIFGPIFFVNLGGKLEFDILVVMKALPAVIILYCSVVVFQVLSAFLFNLTVPMGLKWWKPYYLGFKDFSLFGVRLSRPEPANVPDHMPQYREMMEAERKRYTEKS